MTVNVVKIQARSMKGRLVQHFITIPMEAFRELGLSKGDKLMIRTMELEVDGVKRKALVCYKP